MSDQEPIEVSEAALPGIGLRNDFLTGKGRRIGVVSHGNGQRDLLVYADDDPDACVETIALSPSEADALAEFLGTRRVMERLANLSEQVASLRTQKITVTSDSPFAAKRLGDTQIRSRTGASIVAVIRNREAIASPTPNFELHLGDQLIVVGTQEALTSVNEIING